VDYHELALSETEFLKRCRYLLVRPLVCDVRAMCAHMIL